MTYKILIQQTNSKLITDLKSHNGFNFDFALSNRNISITYKCLCNASYERGLMCFRIITKDIHIALATCKDYFPFTYPDYKGEAYIQKAPYEVSHKTL